MTDPDLIIDLFAGPRGWSEGLAAHGRTDIGIEWDAYACATAVAAGHATIRADVAQTPCAHLRGRVEGLIGSPPCPTFSAAGRGAGRQITTELRAAIVDALAGLDRLDIHRARMADRLFTDASAMGFDTTEDEDAARSQTAAQAAEAALTVEPARWIAATQPRWITLEQVPAVLPLWVTYARELRSLGYWIWAGILNAADYGVPQTRRRAILIASRDHPVAAPRQTHIKGGAQTLFGELAPWVSMAEALGWSGEDTPARTIAGHRDWFPDDGPAPSLTEKARSMVIRTGNNSMVTGRTGSRAGDGDVQPYERSTDEPAPTLDTQVGSKWKIVLDRRCQNPDGTPVPTVDVDRPAPTVTAMPPGQWVFREIQENGGSRTLDEPALTITASADNGNFRWVHERPATTLMGDARVFSPGGHIANDGRNNDNMIGRSENTIRLTIRQALVLQGFRPDYPVKGTRTAQFGQVGNAFPPPFAAAVLDEVLP